MSVSVRGELPLGTSMSSCAAAAQPSDTARLSPGSWQDGHPLTTYYQYGLGMLALCVHHKRVREGVIRRLLTAQNYGRLGHHGNLVGKGPWAQVVAPWHVCDSRVTLGCPCRHQGRGGTGLHLLGAEEVGGCRPGG